MKLKKFRPLSDTHLQVKVVKDPILPTGPTAPSTISPAHKNSPPIVEEGIMLSKRDILTAVVVLSLVNGAVAMGVAKIVKGGE